MKLCVLIPAYNCAQEISEVISSVALPGSEDEIIVVDDASQDDTLAVAGSLPRVFATRNPTNLGYGGTSQRLYQLSVDRGADLTINIHGDMGHRPSDIPIVLEPLFIGKCDIVVGSRLKHLINLSTQHGWTHLLSPKARNYMPFSRMLGHLGLTWFQNICFGTKLHSFHEGMRGCTRKVVKWILQNNLTNWYDYDTDLIVRASRHGYRIVEVPTPPNYNNQTKSSAPPFRYGLRVVFNSLQTLRNGYRSPHESE